MNLRDFFLRVRALIIPSRVERELDEELAFHIARETQKHIAAGLGPIEARTRAIARFGPVPLPPISAATRAAPAVIDNLTRDIVYAFRTFRRAPLAALTIVVTVALGLGLVAVVFTVYTLFFFASMRCEVRASCLPWSWSGRQTPVRMNTCRWRAPSATRCAARPASSRTWPRCSTAAAARRGHLARSFLVTKFLPGAGSPGGPRPPVAPEDEQHSSGRPVIVLSHAGWHKLFQGERDVIGRRVMIGRAPFEIVGVMPDGFRGLGVTPPDYWAPLALAAQFRDARRNDPDRGDRPAETGACAGGSGRRRLGVGRTTDLPRPRAQGARFGEPRRSLWRRRAGAPGRPIRASLSPRQGALSSDGFGVIFAPLFFAFGLILMIGCANVANLLLARGLSRQRKSASGCRLARRAGASSDSSSRRV